MQKYWLVNKDINSLEITNYYKLKSDRVFIMKTMAQSSLEEKNDIITFDGEVSDEIIMVSEKMTK